MKKNTFYPVVSCAVLCGILAYSGFFQSREMAAYDWMMRTRPIKPASPEIAIIEIADDTLKALGRWPLPRDYHAALIKALTESGCRQIVFDVLFSEETQKDDALAQAMQRSEKVYLAYAFKLDSKAKDPIPSSTEILGNVATPFKYSVEGIGQINIRVDPDGKVRRLPLWVSHGNKLWPSLGLLAAAKRLGYPLEKMRFRPGSVILDNGVAIPVDVDGAYLVNFPGPWKETFLHFSYIDVLKAYSDRAAGKQPWLDLSVFKDKICFVGLTATGTADFRANPFDPVYPMVGTQASVCDNLLRRAFISHLLPLPRALIGAGIFIAAVTACWQFSVLGAFLFCLLFGAIYSALAWSLFAFRGIFIDLFLPLFIIAIVYAAILFRKFFQEAQKRRILESELEIAASIQRSFLPAQVQRIGKVKVRTFLEPAKFVGGDFYDIFAIDDATAGFFIGDVSGKGVAAALIMAQAISILRVIAKDIHDPGRVLEEFNNQLFRILKGRFITGQYLAVNFKEGFWEGACAGHPPLFVFNKTGDNLEQELAASGPPLGLMEKVSFLTVKKLFAPGDRIFMYTDGWSEMRNPKGKEFGVPRLKELLFNNRGQELDLFLENLRKQQQLFRKNASVHDDLTAVILDLGSG